MDSVWRKLAQTSWPSRHNQFCGDFVLRDNLGLGGSRANSAEAIKADMKVDENIARYIIWPNHQRLADDLMQLGYMEDDHANVFQMDPSAYTRNMGCRVTDKLSKELAEFYVQNGVDNARVEIMRRASLRKIFVTYEEQGHIMGAMYGGFEMERAWIYALVVKPSMRRQGVARKIMQTICGALSAKGVTQVALSVLPSNEAAVKLYQSLGFTETSRYYFLERSG